jgi:uncharacterized protein (TIGR04255 family)
VSLRSRVIFRKPPLTDVFAAVTFANNLDVADSRSRFYKLVSKDFPNVVIPEQSKLQFDLGDYTLHSPETNARLEVGMNYLRVGTAAYSDFEKFSAMMVAQIGAFTECYGIQKVSSFALFYKNEIPVRDGQTFADCFRIEVRLPEELGTELHSGKGLLVFREGPGLIFLELDPIATGDRVTGYRLNLTFGCQKEVSLKDGLDEINQLAGLGHEYLDKLFFSIFTDGYLEWLKGR